MHGNQPNAAPKSKSSVIITLVFPWPLKHRVTCSLTIRHIYTRTRLDGSAGFMTLRVKLPVPPADQPEIHVLLQYQSISLSHLLGFPIPVYSAMGHGVVIRRLIDRGDKLEEFPAPTRFHRLRSIDRSIDGSTKQATLFGSSLCSLEGRINMGSTCSCVSNLKSVHKTTCTVTSHLPTDTR